MTGSDSPPSGSSAQNNLDAAREHLAIAQEKYPALLKEYEKLHAEFPNQPEKELMQKALKDVYGNDADKMGAQIAQDANHKYIFDIGENIVQAKAALSEAGLNNVGNKLLRSREVFRIKQTRDALTHPEQSDLSKLDEKDFASYAEQAQKQVDEILVKTRETVVPPDKEEAKQKAIKLLEETESNLASFKKSNTYAITTPQDLTSKEVVDAVHMQEVYTGGYVNALKHSLKDEGYVFDKYQYPDTDKPIDVFPVPPGGTPGDNPLDQLTGRRTELAHHHSKSHIPDAIERSQTNTLIKLPDQVKDLTLPTVKVDPKTVAIKEPEKETVPASGEKAGTSTDQQSTSVKLVALPGGVSPGEEGEEASQTGRHKLVGTGRSGQAQKRNTLSPQSADDGGNPANRDPRYGQAPTGNSSHPPAKTTATGTKDAATTSKETNPGTNTETAPSSRVAGGLSAGVSGYLTYGGIMQTAEGVEQLKNGEVVKGTTNVAVGVTSTTAGGVGLAKAIVNPEWAEKTGANVVFENFERANLALMVVQGVAEVATAPDGKKGEVGIRVGGSMFAATATSSVIEGLGVTSATAGGAALAALGPFAAAAVGGIMIKRAFDMDHMEGDHIRAMNAIAPDDKHSHLNDEVARLKNTMLVAAYGESKDFVRDGNGHVDINNEANLKKAKNDMNPDQRKAMQAIIDVKADKAFQDMVMASAVDGVSAEAYMSEKQIQDYKNDQKAALERQYLQGTLTDVNAAIDTRNAIVPKDAQFALDANKDIILTDPKNQELLKTVLNKEYELTGKATANAEQMTYYWNLWNGKEKLAVHSALEESQKSTAVAISELNSLQWGADPKSHIDVTTEKEKKNLQALRDQANAMADANGGKQNIRTDFVYVATNNNRSNGDVGDIVTTDDRNEKLPAEIMKAYQEIYSNDPQHSKNVEIDQMLYKKDENGNEVPYGLAVWHIVDQKAMQEDDKAKGRHPRDYVNEVAYQIDAKGNVTLTSKTDKTNNAVGTPDKAKQPLTDKQIDAQLAGQLDELKHEGLAKLLGNGTLQAQLNNLKDACKKHGVELTELERKNDGHVTSQDIFNILHNAPLTAGNGKAPVNER